MTVATRRYTVGELERNPPRDRLDWELIDGELIAVSPAADRPSRVGIKIGYLLGTVVYPQSLGRLYGADGGFVLFPERDTMRSPDVAFVRAVRVPSDADRNRFPRLAPDLAVEVHSPSDNRRDAITKIEMYLAAGVRIVWFVDPEAQTVTVFEAGAAPVVLGAGDEITGGAVLPEFRAPVADFFA